jgi:hypothetical protein
VQEVADVLVTRTANEVRPDLLAKDVLAKEETVHAVSLRSRAACSVSKGKGELLIGSLEALSVSRVVVVQLDVRLLRESSELCVSQHRNAVLKAERVS